MYISAQHHSPDRAAAAFEGLGIERLCIMARRLGHIDRNGARRRVDPLGLVTVGVTLPVRVALVKLGAEEALPLDLHGQVEHLGENRSHALSTMLNQMFHQGRKCHILPLVHSRLSVVGSELHGIPRMDGPG